jgi:hypothetical protein
MKKTDGDVTSHRSSHRTCRILQSSASRKQACARRK